MEEWVNGSAFDYWMTVANELKGSHIENGGQKDNGKLAGWFKHIVIFVIIANIISFLPFRLLQSSKDIHLNKIEEASSKNNDLMFLI